MGAVCSAGMVERNVELGGKNFGFSGILIKENSFVIHEDAISNSKSDSGQGRKQKRHDSGFYKEELFRDFTIWAKGKVSDRDRARVRVRARAKARVRVRVRGLGSARARIRARARARARARVKFRGRVKVRVYSLV
ncbi:hypothetical protein VIGAN_01398500 [Vigna angularis var. angularis]|uniref:Uncharacterized protein n=1 Tax=Vigna angularis var. angularis TaxID=157739 RepID=A0A0S3R666_PHAAN|nr:hypothetical protein VIGAN_01398500 [Vigna angularis var. angularis]